ncbi:hypothetical protein [Pokkaliibacter plantistimulans]|uniref:hypothetical protein n=1 Tax=Pokkaliibacter plantistimulans TaxID=1635171 RepID=UPI000E30A84B|nr:hypothetical protein [Pokkaliibacter plantistimulans]
MINATLTISIPLDNSGGLLQGDTNKGAAPSQQGSQGGSTNPLADMLADALTQALFQKQGDGATFNNPGNNPLMDMIAKFMDQNKSNYSGPDDATGNVRNWQDEMSEDNYLDKNELQEFTKGLKDALSSVLGGGLQQMLGGAGGMVSDVGNTISGLGGMAGSVAGGALGGLGGSMIGGALGDALGSAIGGSISGLGSQIGGLGGGFGGGFGGAGFGSASPQSTGFGGGSTLGNMSPAMQSGVATAGSFASYAGKTALDSIGTHNDSDTRYFVNKEDREMAKDIGRFMDQNPEIFGKPEYQKDNWDKAKTDDKSWADALSNPDDDGMSKESMDKFKQAISMLKDTMDGKSTGNQQTDMDAMLLANSLVNQAMHKVAA